MEKKKEKPKENEKKYVTIIGRDDYVKNSQSIDVPIPPTSETDRGNTDKSEDEK
jgi:hypothetical protein